MIRKQCKELLLLLYAPDIDVTVVGVCAVVIFIVVSLFISSVCVYVIIFILTRLNDRWTGGRRRLMALPDEIPLIKIPCIMVSRRIQYYLEALLRFYHPIDQHIVSIQPTGVFGKYEERNRLKLPERF